MYIKQLKYSCRVIYNLFSENQYTEKQIYLPKALLKYQDGSTAMIKSCSLVKHDLESGIYHLFAS